MIDLHKHKYYLFQILKDIYTDFELAGSLGFKGGTALLFFYELPRFSVDLDFNLLHADKKMQVYDMVRSIVLKYGTIFDEAQKHFGQILVLNYGTGERKLKIEISNRQYNDTYEVKNLLGLNINVMTAPDMFAHKLCALLDRTAIANRDIFDCWFFMDRQTPVNRSIVESRMKMPYDNYLDKCILHLENLSDKSLLAGMGQLMDPKMKAFVRTKLRIETIILLRFYKENPISI